MGTISKAPEHNRVPGVYLLAMKEASDTGTVLLRIVAPGALYGVGR